MGDEVLRERRGGVELVTINRPEARNAINGAVTVAMSAAFDEISDDDAVQVVVLTGAGDKAFSAGMDLKAFATGDTTAMAGVTGGFAGITQRRFPKPLIAAVNGAALAGGLEIMLACDMAVAADHASFGIPEVKRGLMAGAGGLLRLPQRLPMAIALELALSGDPIDAARALELGLVNAVVPGDRVLDEALALGERVAANGPLALRWTKAVMTGAARVPEDEGWALNAEGVTAVFGSEDAKEGPRAFIEKRAPRWQGR